MCGRFALYSDPLSLARQFDAEAPADLLPRYNVAPTQAIPIVRVEAGQRHFASARWGLIPHWAKAMDTSYSTINARAETVASKPAFRDAFRHRRALIPIDNFFEWQTLPGSKLKQPWAIALQDREPMALAGLWEQWRNPLGGIIESCTIIVTDSNANEIMRPIHERIPVILAPEDWDAWLDPDAKDTGQLQSLLVPYPAEGMTAWKVGTRVNNSRHESPDCTEPLEEQGG